MWIYKISTTSNVLVSTFIIRNKISRKFEVIAEENIPFVSKAFNIHIRNRSNRSSTSLFMIIFVTHFTQKHNKKITKIEQEVPRKKFGILLCWYGSCDSSFLLTFLDDILFAGYSVWLKWSKLSQHKLVLH